MKQGQVLLHTAVAGGNSAINLLLSKEKKLFDDKIDRIRESNKKYEEQLQSILGQIEIIKLLLYRSKKTIGTITGSEEIETEDGTGYKITFEYFDNKGERIEYSSSSSVHWVSNEEWMKFKKNNEVGQGVIIFYDPDETHKFIFFHPE